MQDNNAAISAEEAQLLLKTPESNTINVSQEVSMKFLVLSIKQYLMTFNEVHLESVGTTVGKTLSAV